MSSKISPSVKLKKPSQARFRLDGSFLDYYLPLLGIFQYYVFGSVGSYGSIILYAYGAVHIVLTVGRKDIYVHKGLLLFVLYALISQPIIFDQYGGWNSSRFFNYATVAYIFLLLVFFSNRLNLGVFYRNYAIVASVASIAIVVQAFQLYILNQPVSGIALLPCDTSSWYDGGNRPCGLFPEPSVYAYYMLPVLFLALQRKHVRTALLFSACIVISTSTLGILCCALLWFWYLLIQIKDVRKCAIYCVALVLAAGVLFETQIAGIAFEKIVTTDYMNSPRLTRGWFIFLNLDFWEQLFGIGFNNLQYYIDSGRVMLTDYASSVVSFENRAYVTSVYQVLIGYGVIGFLLYFVPFVRQLLKERGSRILLVLFLALSLAQTMFFSMNFLLWMIPLFNLLDKDSSDSFIKIPALKRFRTCRQP